MVVGDVELNENHARHCRGEVESRGVRRERRGRQKWKPKKRREEARVTQEEA